MPSSFDLAFDSDAEESIVVHDVNISGQRSPKEALVRFRISSSKNNLFDLLGKENRAFQLASAQEKPFCAIFGSR